VATVVFDHVSKGFGDVVAVRDLSLEVADGEFMVIVGPSGSGKTTALRLVAGLEALTGGQIRVAERVVDRLAPRDRDIAMVFQDYALYPQMTVEQNLAFGLKTRRMPRDEIQRRVRRAAEMLDIEDLLERKPRALSGGQRQRVALGRALVREPQAFLMDEPLSNLDAKLRVQTRSEIKHLQERVGTTTVYVTHDQIEAMTMGDRVAVMNEGTLEQVGDPRALYDHPANVFVAGFIGSPAMRFVTAGARLERAGLHLSNGSFAVDVEAPRLLGSAVPAEVILGVRPEHTSLWDGAADRLLGPIDGRVEFVEMLGRETLIGVEAGEGARFTVHASSDTAVRAGDPMRFGLEPGRLYLFDAATEAALGVV
jgi:ABC-type sugar transport system ATPase subunit